MGPRGPMMGRGRGPPPRPRMMTGPRPGMPRPIGAAPSPSPNEPTVAPSWMSRIKVEAEDDDFAQPVPVSKLTSAARDKPESSDQDSILKDVTATALPPAPSMPPWAKPFKAKTAESASSGVGGESPAVVASALSSTEQQEDTKTLR